jgi:hypothetical protein
MNSNPTNNFDIFSIFSCGAYYNQPTGIEKKQVRVLQLQPFKRACLNQRTHCGWSL